MVAAAEQLAVEAQRTAQNERARKSRAARTALGLERTEIELSAGERATLDNSRTVRGGHSGAYEIKEYIATLIRRDAQALEQQLAALGECAFCHRPLPVGCGGANGTDAACDKWRAERALAL